MGVTISPTTSPSPTRTVPVTPSPSNPPCFGNTPRDWYYPASPTTCLPCPADHYGPFSPGPCTTAAATCREGRCSPPGAAALGCAAGYAGYLCDGCTSGNFKTVSGDCAPCPQSFFPALAMIALVFVTLLILLVAFFKRSDPQRRAAFSALVSKLLPLPLLRDHFTRLFVLHRLGTVPFPRVFARALGFSAFLGFDFSSAGPECAIPGANFRTKWFSVVGGLSCLVAIGVVVDLTRAAKAAGGVRAAGGALKLLRRAHYSATVSALSLALPVSSTVCWSALSTATDPGSGKTVLYWDVTLRVYEYPQVVVSTLSMAILFFYAVWVCGAVFRAVNLKLNGAPPVAVTLATWLAAVRASGLLRSVSVILSPKPAASMALLVSLGVVELVAAFALFDRVHRAFESDAGELAPPPPLMPPAWAVGFQWGHLNPHFGNGLAALLQRFRTPSHAHLWLVLGASFLSQCTGLDYELSRADPSSAAATGWGAILIFLNAAPVLVLGYALARDAGPGFCKMFPTAAEHAAARLAGGGAGDEFHSDNPLNNAGHDARASGEAPYDESCWFECRDGDGDRWFEHYKTGDTAWEMPPGARLVPPPVSPYLPPG